METPTHEPPENPDRADIVVIGAGAAGLMAAIAAARESQRLAASAAPSRRPPAARVVALDGAKTLGAKILVAGGGRCNVTHHEVHESAYAGSSRHAIKQVLRAFDVRRTVDFFREIGVELKREDTGKLFPTTDRARTVLDALLNTARDAGVSIHYPWRVAAVERREAGFVVRRAESQSSGDEAELAPKPLEIIASRVILATGGMALPRSGSDGAGYAIAQRLGHDAVMDAVREAHASPESDGTTGRKHGRRVFPALVPLVLDAACPLRALPGISAHATIELRSHTGRRLVSFTNAVLCTHFGVSGPAVLDISRYYLDAAFDAKPGERPTLVVNWIPGMTSEEVDRSLLALGPSTVGKWLARHGLPERLARTLCDAAGVYPGTPGRDLTRESRRSLARAVSEYPLPVAGDRGFTHAEVTAGGIPLSDVHLSTMESRRCAGLHLCGEILDVDGRIGGFNFQWAWASGHVAGIAAARACATRTSESSHPEPAPDSEGRGASSDANT